MNEINELLIYFQGFVQGIIIGCLLIMLLTMRWFNEK